MADRRGNSVERYYASKKKRRKSRKAKLYIFLTLFCITAFIVLSLTVFFNIKNFEVQGNVTYSKSRIIKVMGLAEGDNLFRLNKFKIAETLSKELPYISSVEIYRKLPTTLCVDVQECSAALVVYSGGKYILLNSELKVLEEKEELPEGIAYLIGAEFAELKVGNTAVFAKDTIQQQVLALMDGLQQHFDFSKISAIDVTESYNLRLYYDNHRVKILLGNTDDLSDKLQMAQTTVKQNSVSEYARIDITASTSAYYRALGEEEIDDVEQMLLGNAVANEDKTYEKVEDTAPEDTSDEDTEE
ncbi:MAG: FtsQ-type POTRA domain-containing protein [Clostridia bacterium]|nr:FtsQ-type POTRA domain-containing protein [Clostridia bacterium]